MNYAVDGEKKDAADVVREFLHQHLLEVLDKIAEFWRVGIGHKLSTY